MVFLATGPCSNAYNFSPTLDGRYRAHPSRSINAFSVFCKYSWAPHMDWWNVYNDGASDKFAGQSMYLMESGEHHSIHVAIQTAH